MSWQPPAHWPPPPKPRRMKGFATRDKWIVLAGVVACVLYVVLHDLGVSLPGWKT